MNFKDYFQEYFEEFEPSIFMDEAEATDPLVLHECTPETCVHNRPQLNNN